MSQPPIAYYKKTRGSFRPLRPAHDFKRCKDRVALLWGDPVYVIRDAGTTATVSAKGHHLAIPSAHLMDKPVLSIYQIDCGQGDAALVHFPDDRWMMVDAGPPRGVSNCGNIAADFLYWKMFVDQSWKNEFGPATPFRIDAVVCTHPDQDHYGGFLDMTRHLKAGTLEYGAVYHCGLGRFAGRPATSYRDGKGFGQLGMVEGFGLPDAWVTTLIDGWPDVRKWGGGSGARKWRLAGDYADWLRELRQLHRKKQGVGPLKRLYRGVRGFRPSSAVRVKVLGPIDENWKGKRRGLRYLDTAGASSMQQPSRTRNGHSVVLRLDYDKARVLLTGDLNFRSQALLLKHVPRREFECHVAKACHHGSEDVSWKFLQAMSPYATLFSSGDNERYAHPRARVLGLAGAAGKWRVAPKSTEYLGLEERRFIAPLVYSTELSRSMELWDPYAVFDSAGERVPGAQLQARGKSIAGRDRGPRAALDSWLLANKMVYGLVNVRTDGKRVVLGVLNEDEASFQTEEFTVDQVSGDGAPA